MKFFSFKWFFIISCCGQLTVIAIFVKLMIMIEIIKNDVIIITIIIIMIIIMIIVMIIIIMIITIIMIIMTTIIMMIIKAIMILIVKLYHREHAPK